MIYEIKGNYFNGKYNMPQTKGNDAVENFITRECPSDINTILWTLPIEYRHVNAVIESAVDGFHSWRKISINERIQFLKKLLGP